MPHFGHGFADFAGSTSSSIPNSCGSVSDASGFVQKAISRPGALHVACIHRTGGKAVLPDMAGAASGFFLRKVQWDGSGRRLRLRTSRTGGGWRESIDESEPGEPGCGYGFLAGALSCFFC